MTAYIALLRGINVAGHAKVAMSQLRQAIADLGYTDVQTYIQSGNLLFGSSRPMARVVTDIEAQLQRSFALDVKVLLRTSRQWQDVISGNPLLPSSRDESALHVTFLTDAPAAARTAAIAGQWFGPDEYRVSGREVYLYCPNGYGRTKLNNTFFERSLGTAATTRNWNTVKALARLVRP